MLIPFVDDIIPWSFGVNGYDAVEKEPSHSQFRQRDSQHCRRRFHHRKTIDFCVELPQTLYAAGGFHPLLRVLKVTDAVKTMSCVGKQAGANLDLCQHILATFFDIVLQGAKNAIERITIGNERLKLALRQLIKKKTGQNCIHSPIAAAVAQS